MKAVAPILCGFVLGAAASSGAAPPRYRVTAIELPLRPGYAYAQPVAMNDLGQVVGYTGNDEPVGGEVPTLTWVWSPATGITFPGIEGHPSAVNNAGQIVITGGARWTPGVGLEQLAVPPNNINDNIAWSINGAGVVAGHASFVTDDVNGQGAVWPTPAVVQAIPKLPGATQGASASHVNDRGDVTGWSDVAPHGVPDTHSFLLTTAEGLVGLGALPGDPTNVPTGLNNLGHVVGVSGDTQLTRQRGFFWTREGGMQELPQFGGRAFVPVALNDTDAVVGHTAGQGGVPVYWTPLDGAYDLNALLDPSAAGWTVGGVFDLNDAGQVLAAGARDGQPWYVLLTPVPEPAAATGLACLALVAKRRARAC